MPADKLLYNDYVFGFTPKTKQEKTRPMQGQIVSNVTDIVYLFKLHEFNTTLRSWVFFQSFKEILISQF